MTRKAPSQSPRRQHGSGSTAELPDHHTAGQQAGAPRASATPPEGQGSEQGTYAVGFGRPPLHSRFKPGQSGNPKGRPKQSQNLRTIVKQVSNEQIQIREGDRPRRMPRMEALVRTTFTRAFKDPKALASLMVLLRQCGYGACDLGWRHVDRSWGKSVDHRRSAQAARRALRKRARIAEAMVFEHAAVTARS